jgi:hypothetical protein
MTLARGCLGAARAGAFGAGGRWDSEAKLEACPPPPPPSRTKWTRRVPHPVLIGHAASLSQACLTLGGVPWRHVPAWRARTLRAPHSCGSTVCWQVSAPPAPRGAARAAGP